MNEEANTEISPRINAQDFMGMYEQHMSAVADGGELPIFELLAQALIDIHTNIGNQGFHEFVTQFRIKTDPDGQKYVDMFRNNLIQTLKASMPLNPKFTQPKKKRKK